MSLADDVQGRVISQTIHVKLEPLRPVTELSELGETDVAMEVGRGLVIEAMKVLQMAAEAEGFKVTVSLGQVIY
jgi:hypothetical protein